MSNLIAYPGHEIVLEDIVKAENCTLHDIRGKPYVDLESGVWCTAIGHGHPRVVQALQDQAARIMHAGYCYSNEMVRSAADEILSALGLAGGRGVFLCSGSEAIEFGVRSLQRVMEKPLLLTMTDSYFGAYGSAHRRAQDEWFRYDWLACNDCPTAADGSPDCEHWRHIPFERIGGFLFEPGSSSGFVRFPPEALIRALATRIRDNGGFLMVNEVTTGLGRTGTWFGYQHYGLQPDVVALGKGLGNGYPVSFAAFAPGILEPLSRNPLPYAQSHQNDPLGAAVAREVVRVIREERLIERSADSAAILRNGLEEMQKRTGRITALRGRGLMIAVDLGDDAFARRVQEELVQRGFILARRAGTGTLRIDPALTIEVQDLRDFLVAFESVLIDG
jgi:acetylornithine aminotransferase